MATTSRPFQQGDTWRKLGYVYFTNSLDYREVIDQNPQWTVVENPPVGAQLRITSSGLSSNEQSTFLGGLESFYTQDIIFPFTETDEFIAATIRYPLPALLNPYAINGYSQDDEQAFTGYQSLG
jgi:hypothetical protein